MQKLDLSPKERCGTAHSVALGVGGGSEIMEGRLCWGWQAPGLLLHPVPSSHVAVVMSSLKGLAENQKLHKLPPKPVGCHSSPPSSVQLVFLSLQLLICCTWNSFAFKVAAFIPDFNPLCVECNQI